MRELVSKIRVFNADEMVQLGYHFASILRGNELVCLEGPLGSGKTTFAKGFGIAFNIKEEIISPSFLILREYKGTHPIYHYDLYRLKSLEELEQIGFFDHLGREGIKMIEWADKFPELYKYTDWIIKYELLGVDKRVVEFYECHA